MELSIQKWGNSAAVRLPTELLSQLKVVLGDKLTVDVRADGVMLKAKRPSYVLADLIAQCDPSAAAPADLDAWHHTTPVGREAW
ncbi:AbrB/MazE/SpoVT family DNA-binding domain-containing protein [Herbaspirillum sp. RTI4]|uniref:AbrB/MazE/SpoVT family DNA-binding domain-containing protein n=1 Tax=Herbaspirillum sp. RTI4 TaxID=3048640 RepID=UPI002AB3B67C|nr:AbrB/MazE/SpoVT family DNA-binding domain-containing protein [Herbaspirillum sp. RTI4]MDY7577964.1 AbrB/MazE/SpoVT family DNA-binding domain-containing protein [Herbaspirillum sp. RTI4]MEA9981590.1 AbrB/MazE/SpoVT family DNA-binding domain-containing protein [Herbaspirillum sp. RTI4]